jgi:hypothetical protein
MADSWHLGRRWRRPEPWFAAAWLFLVIVIAFGFFLQARTIARIDTDEQAVEELIEQTQAQQTMNAESLCKLLLANADSRMEVVETVAAFRFMGYTCPRGGDS